MKLVAGRGIEPLHPGYEPDQSTVTVPRDEIEKLPGILSLLLPLLLAGTQPSQRRASNPDLQVTSIQPNQPSLEPCTLTQTVLV